MLHAVLVPISEDDRRSAERLTINQRSTLRDETSAACDVYVADLSETGFSVTTDARLVMGSKVSIGLPGQGRATARVVRRVNGGYGCEFLHPLSPDALAQTFRGDTVIQLSSSDPFTQPLPEPEIRRFHGAIRIGVIVGSSAALWALIIGAAARLL